MKRIDDGLITPVFVKTSDDPEWPEGEKVFYMISGDGLHLCRNHEFFRSCVPAPSWPSELAEQKTFLRIRYPHISPRRIEQVVGFFDLVWKLHGGEAAVMLARDRETNETRVIVPEQVTTVIRTSRGDLYPSGVRYAVPSLPAHLTVYCDIHSHCDLSAYASSVDTNDEAFRAGLHAVVGRLHQEPPQFHTEAVVDGVRFQVASTTLFGGYTKRAYDFPRWWLDKVEVSSAAGGCQGGERPPKVEESFS
jgi:hypothetical protein